MEKFNVVGRSSRYAQSTDKHLQYSLPYRIVSIYIMCPALYRYIAKKNSSYYKYIITAAGPNIYTLIIYFLFYKIGYT